MPAVLFVEDSRTFQRLMPRYLPEGWELVIHDNPAAAWAAIRTRAFDLVVTDFVFPQGDAFELVFQIRQRFSPQQLPVIVLTSAADRFLVSKLFVAGANATVAKPPDVPAFRDLVIRMVAAPWTQPPDTPCEDAHLVSWGTADEYVVFCPNLNFFTRAPSHQAALEAMQERIREHMLAGERIAVTTTPKLTRYFPPQEPPPHAA